MFINNEIKILLLVLSFNIALIFESVVSVVSRVSLK